MEDNHSISTSSSSSSNSTTSSTRVFVAVQRGRLKELQERTTSTAASTTSTSAVSSRHSSASTTNMAQPWLQEQRHRLEQLRNSQKRAAAPKNTSDTGSSSCSTTTSSTTSTTTTTTIPPPQDIKPQPPQEDASYQAFVLDLKRELACHHTELWQGFQQDLLGLPQPQLPLNVTMSSTSTTTTTSNKTQHYRLHPTSKHILSTMHRHLKEHYPSHSYCATPQLLRDSNTNNINSNNNNNNNKYNNNNNISSQIAEPTTTSTSNTTSSSIIPTETHSIPIQQNNQHNHKLTSRPSSIVMTKSSSTPTETNSTIPTNTTALTKNPGESILTTASLVPIQPKQTTTSTEIPLRTNHQGVHHPSVHQPLSHMTSALDAPKTTHNKKDPESTLPSTNTISSERHTTPHLAKTNLGYLSKQTTTEIPPSAIMLTQSPEKPSTNPPISISTTNTATNTSNNKEEPDVSLSTTPFRIKPPTTTTAETSLYSFMMKHPKDPPTSLHTAIEVKTTPVSNVTTKQVESESTLPTVKTKTTSNVTTPLVKLKPVYKAHTPVGITPSVLITSYQEKNSNSQPVFTTPITSASSDVLETHVRATYDATKNNEEVAGSLSTVSTLTTTPLVKIQQGHAVPTHAEILQSVLMTHQPEKPTTSQPISITALSAASETRGRGQESSIATLSTPLVKLKRTTVSRPKPKLIRSGSGSKVSPKEEIYSRKALHSEPAKSPLFQRISTQQQGHSITPTIVNQYYNSSIPTGTRVPLSDLNSLFYPGVTNKEEMVSMFTLSSSPPSILALGEEDVCILQIFEPSAMAEVV
jgi:hypothetical protein